MSKRKARLVRYVSPFGTPAWMSEEKAQQLLEEEDRKYVKLQQEGLLEQFVTSPEVGPPRIERHPA